MQVVVFGASGALGQHIVTQALQRGHLVTAIVRRDGALAARPGLTITVAQLADRSVLAEALLGTDVVISALGPNFRMGSRAPVDFAQRTLPPLVDLIREAAVPRFVLVSAFGVGDTVEKASGIARVAFRLATAPLFADKAAAEARLPSSNPVTTVVYPVNLKETGSVGTAAIKPVRALKKVPGLPTLPFVDAATAIVSVATAQDFSDARLVITTPTGWR